MAHADKKSARRTIKAYGLQLAEAKSLLLNPGERKIIAVIAASGWFDDTLRALVKGLPLPDKPTILCQ